MRLIDDGDDDEVECKGEEDGMVYLDVIGPA